MPSIPRFRTSIFLLFSLAALVLLPVALSSSGDRNPTFTHCLKGCQLTYCDPSHRPISLYLRMFGWTCAENCAYKCSHSFTDHIRPGSKHHQFYGKWAFYRLGPFQEPLSILMSLGNLYVNIQGLESLRRRVRSENKLKSWLVVMAWIQINTWIWSTVFHSRDTPTTERLDYFSATLTISFTLLYSIIRIFQLQTPLTSSRLLLPVSALIGFIVLGHFTYLLSFPRHSFPYGYHTAFNLVLASIHNVLWVLFSLSFKLPFPSFSLNIGSSRIRIGYPQPYPPNDPYPASASTTPKDAMTPISLVILTTLAMSFELLDFPPIFRVIDAHSLWHACTIPLTVAWWHFLINDAIELEGSLLVGRGQSNFPLPTTNSHNQGDNDKFPPLSSTSSLAPNAQPPSTPNFAQLAAGSSFARNRSPGPSPKLTKPE